MIKMTQPKIYTRGVKLWVRFSLNGEVIKKSLNIEDTKANRKLATTQIIPQMLLKVHSGKFFENTIVPTVKDMIAMSLEIHKANRKHLTHKGYEYILNKRVIPHFGNRKIDTIKPSELALWQNQLLENLSSRSVISARVIFNTIFEDALRDELIEKNPFSIVKSPALVYLREIEPFNKDEIFQILNDIPLKVRLFFAIGFFTGARTGEITALKVKDIDLDNKTISISRTRNHGVETSPKTKSSIREIDILDVLVPYIKEHLEIHPNNEYLFETRHKSPYYSANQLSRLYWEKSLKRLNIKFRNLYQMRHTFASMMISSGEDILWVSSMLGHKNSNITLSTYAKFVKNTKKQRGAFLLD
jgi:integrase